MGQCQTAKRLPWRQRGVTLEKEVGPWSPRALKMGPWKQGSVGTGTWRQEMWLQGIVTLGHRNESFKYRDGLFLER